MPRSDDQRAELLRDPHVRGPGSDRDPSPDRPARQQRREQQLDQHVLSRVDRRNDHRMGEQRRHGEKDPKDRVRDAESRNESGQRLGNDGAPRDESGWSGRARYMKRPGAI